MRQFLAKRAFAFLNRCRPHLLFQELLLELLPIATQTVPRENFSYPAKIDGVSFDELKYARFIFCTPRFERDGDYVLGREDTDRRIFHIFFHGGRECFLQKRTAGGKKLHRPITNYHVVAFHSATAVPQILKNVFEADDARTGLGLKLNENIDIERGDRLEIEGCSNGAADGIAFNYTVGLHAVDGLNRFFYCHFARISLTHRRLERAESQATAEHLWSQKENKIA